MADEENEQTEGEQEAKPKSNMMLFIIIGVVVLIGGGVGAMLMMGGGEEKKEGEQDSDLEVTYETAALDPIIVNLSQNTRFLKAKLLVEYDPSLVYEGGKPPASQASTPREPDDPLPGILGKREPMIKDAVLRLLSAKTVEEVLTADGKEQIKEELIEVINEASGIDEGAVTAIYYIEFIIQ